MCRLLLNERKTFFFTLFLEIIRIVTMTASMQTKSREQEWKEKNVGVKSKNNNSNNNKNNDNNNESIKSCVWEVLGNYGNVDE